MANEAIVVCSSSLVRRNANSSCSEIHIKSTLILPWTRLLSEVGNWVGLGQVSTRTGDPQQQMGQCWYVDRATGSLVCCWECSLGRHSEKHWRASCTFPRETKTCCHPQICSHVFIDILVTTGLNCNNVSGLLNGRWRIKDSKNQSIVQLCKWMLFGLKRD